MNTSDRWQLIADNFSIVNLQRATLTLSTVELSSIPGIRDYSFESCLFSENGNSEIVARYYTISEAITGHITLCRKYGLA